MYSNVRQTASSSLLCKGFPTKAVCVCVCVCVVCVWRVWCVCGVSGVCVCVCGVCGVCVVVCVV